MGLGDILKRGLQAFKGEERLPLGHARQISHVYVDRFGKRVPLGTAPEGFAPAMPIGIPLYPPKTTSSEGYMRGTITREHHEALVPRADETIIPNPPGYSRGRRATDTASGRSVDFGTERARVLSNMRYNKHVERVAMRMAAESGSIGLDYAAAEKAIAGIKGSRTRLMIPRQG